MYDESSNSPEQFNAAGYADALCDTVEKIIEVEQNLSSLSNHELQEVANELGRRAEANVKAHQAGNVTRDEGVSQQFVLSGANRIVRKIAGVEDREPTNPRVLGNPAIGHDLYRKIKGNYEGTA